jgi:hypothetical protein
MRIALVVLGLFAQSGTKPADAQGLKRGGMLSFVVVAEPPPTWAACAEQFRADWRLAAPTLPVHPKIDARIFAT